VGVFNHDPKSVPIQEALARWLHKLRATGQTPLEEKRKFAHYVIDTSGPKEETLRQVRETYESLRRISP